jgi:hypothetical protein
MQLKLIWWFLRQLLCFMQPIDFLPLVELIAGICLLKVYTERMHATNTKSAEHTT